MQNQTKTCIAKSSCEICTLLRYYKMYSVNSSLMFWDNLSHIIINSQEIAKGEQSTTEVN